MAHHLLGHAAGSVLLASPLGGLSLLTEGRVLCGGGLVMGERDNFT